MLCFFRRVISTLLSQQRTLLLCTCLSIAACASAPPEIPVDANGFSWVQSIIDYQYQLPADHPDQIDKVFVINDEMREEVQAQFSMLSKHGAAEAMAHWLIEDYGRNMAYDINANLAPIEAYEQRRGNCLSFTILLSTLAKELGIEIEYNEVDIPDTWDMNEGLGMVFYRHVNGVLEALGKRQIFDLAMDLYDSGYPQRYVSELQILAMLLNNRAIAFMDQEQIESAKHAIKLAVSYSPKNPDLWANLGVIEKRHGDLQHAEQAFLYAYGLSKYNVVAVSNLERFYREQGQHSRAAQFAKQAERARQSNPYVHYQKALALYQEKKYRKAMRTTKRAISLHKTDPKFFELQSLIAQQQGDYRKALLAIEQAYLASSSTRQRGKYADKAELVTRNAISAAEQNARANRVRVYKEVEIRNSGIFQ